MSMVTTATAALFAIVVVALILAGTVYHHQRRAQQRAAAMLRHPSARRLTTRADTSPAFVGQASDLHLALETSLTRQLLAGDIAPAEYRKQMGELATAPTVSVS